MHQNNMLRRAHDVETSDRFDGGVVPEPVDSLSHASPQGRNAAPQSEATGLLIGPSQPCLHVPLAMENAPDVDVIVPLKVKNQIWESCDLASAQPRQFQFVRESGRACRGPGRYDAIGVLECDYETQGNIGTGLIGIIVNRVLDVTASHEARNDGFGAHPATRLLTRSCKPSK